MLEVILIVVCSLETIALVALVAMFWRGTEKILDQDELLGFLNEDIEIAMSYYDKILKTPLFFNNSEVTQMHNNVKIMRLRFEEFNRRVKETRGLKELDEQNKTENSGGR